VPIPPILLLLKREHQLTKHVTNLHFVHGGVPLPISEDDFIKCLEFAVLIIKTYPARRSKDKSEARSERAAAEEFQKALYAATREYHEVWVSGFGGDMTVVRCPRTGVEIVEI